MKQKILISAVASSMLLANASAQKDSSGIYKTAGDFQLGKLSYAINYKTQSHKINDNLLFNESEIKIKHEGTSYTLKKSDTYGYRDVNGIDYRFVDNKSLKILSRGDGMLLYTYRAPKDGKGATQYTSMYYFSKDVASTPELLTKENVKAAYPDNHKFHDAVDATFKDDGALAEYDSFHHMYKINHILLANK